MSPVIFEPLKMVDYSNPHRITYSGSTSENMSDNAKTLYKGKKKWIKMYLKRLRFL